MSGRVAKAVGNSLLLKAVRLDNGLQLKVTNPKDKETDVEEEDNKGE